MPNPRLIQLAERLGNKDLPKQRTPKKLKGKKKIIPEIQVGESRILTYDQDKELILKSNELFKQTQAEIPLQDNGEVQNMYILKRLALIFTIYNNPQLKSLNIWPITPLQSEQLLKANKLPKPSEYWEDLSLILYSLEGKNPNEAKALHESLQKNRDNLSLSGSDLQNRLLIINPGIEVDSNMPHGVKPIVLPGLTQIYPHETLKQTEDKTFEYGLEHGLPSVKDLGKGDRTLYMPSEPSGLRYLYRCGGLDLCAWGDDLVYSGSDGRVNLAKNFSTGNKG